MSKRKLDEFDLAAEREGNALRNQIRVHRPMGKRIMKIRRGHASGTQKIQTRIEKRHV